MSLKRSSGSVTTSKKSSSLKKLSVKKAAEKADEETNDAFIEQCEAVYLSVLNDIEEEISSSEELMLCKLSGLILYLYLFYKKCKVYQSLS